MTSETMNGELTALCGACGLCCDGSLFGRVPLAPEEATPARRRRLRVVRDGSAFAQPCIALAPDVVAASAARAAAAVPDMRTRVCRIYEERPRACAAFSCRLCARHRREGGPLESRLAAVRRVRQLVCLLDGAGVAPADFDGDAAGVRARGPEGARLAEAFTELSRRLEHDFARADPNG